MKPIDASAIKITDSGAVVYQSRKVGQIRDTGKRFAGGRGEFWRGESTGLHYSKMGAAVAEERRNNKE